MGLSRKPLPFAPAVLNLAPAATDQCPKGPSIREPFMRAIHTLAILATLALGAAIAVPAQAQDLIQASPPTDSFAPIPAPIFDELKAEVATGQPPKAGSAWVLEAWPTEWRTPTKSKRATTEQIRPNR
jgi:hypothetical protein